MKLILRKADDKQLKLQQMLDKIKKYLQSSTAVRAMCWRYGVNPESISSASIEFADLPVSAKTKNTKIYINKSFLEDANFSEEIHYIVHELCHWLQQTCDDPYRLIPDDQSTDYLDMPSEFEAFMFQVQFMKENYGVDRARQYVDELLDFHKITGKEKEKKKKDLLLE